MLENSTHAFIVRIWLETREVATLPAPWRAVVQHVASGEQRYFTDFEQLISFIVQKADLPKPDDHSPGEQ